MDCTLTKHSGGFATIDPRHADDTPQSSAYGSNSPQATNKNKPHHHNKHTKTCRTRPTQPPKKHTTLAHPSNHGGFCNHRPLHGHAALAVPSNHAGGFATIDPRHADDTPQHGAYGSNSPPKQTATTNHTTPARQRHLKDNQHCHLKGTRRWPFQATTRGVLRP